MRTSTLDLLVCPYTGTALRPEVVDGDADELRFGVLHGEGGSFPVVAGIPVLRAGRADLVGLVRDGEHDAAVRRAAFGEIAPSGLRRAGRWLAETERLRGLGERLEARRWRRIDERARALTAEGTSVRALFDLAYRQLHLRNPEVYVYNWYRFGVPRHLAALAALEWAPPVGPVLDLGCGAGHLTWSVTGHVAPAPVIGVDGLFFALYVAATRLVPDADFVCADLDALPLRDGAVRGIWASDVFHALQGKAATARELRRVRAEPGWSVIAGLTVRDHEHEYPGRPLSAAAYLALLPEGTVLVADADLVEGYRAGRAADRRTPAGAGAPAVTALHSDPGLEAADGARFDGWPHGRGQRGVNPIFEADGDRLHRTMPSPAYEREHGGLRAYTPESADLSDDERRLVESFVVLGFPPGYLDAGA
jgi:ubiquinone/menaquinone biosynthesis C-methylase UbiE